MAFTQGGRSATVVRFLFSTMEQNRNLDVRRLKTGGRQKGTPNRITKVLKFQLSQVLTLEYERIPELLSELSPSQRLNFVVRLSQFVLPTPTRGVDEFDLIRLDGSDDWGTRPATVSDYFGTDDPEPDPDTC